MRIRRSAAGAVLAAWILALLAGPPAVAAQRAEGLPPGADNLPEVVARVDGYAITRVELLAQVQLMRLQALRAGTTDPATSEEFLDFVLDALIGERLVYTDSEARGVAATDAQVEEKLAAMIASYPDRAAFERSLGGRSIETVKGQLRQNLSIDTVMRKEILSQLEISEEQLRAFYDQATERMRLPPQSKVRHILMRVPVVGGAGAKEEVRAKLLALRQQITDGADFAALARQHSEDAGSREQGGELPWIVLTGRQRTFEQAVAELEVGALSDAVESEQGWHLIQLLDHRPARVRTYEEARTEIANILAALEARKEIQRRVVKLRAEAKIEILM